MRKLVLACVALLALGLPAAASAAPDRTTTLSSATPQFAWDGPEAAGAYNPAGTYAVENCSKDAATYCDTTLVQVKSGGPFTLNASISGYSNPLADFDLYLYGSNAAGTAATGDQLSDSGGTSGAGLPNGFGESVSVGGLEPGHYLVVVVYYETLGAASYKGTISVTGATPAPGGDEPPAPEAPAQAALPFRAASTVGSARKARTSRALSFKATADRDISDLVVHLLSGKPGAKQKVLATFRAARFAAGTRALTLKLSRRVARKLRKGSYTLAARGSVDGQALQATQAVTVRK